jgi:hypothetical protein
MAMIAVSANVAPIDTIALFRKFTAMLVDVKIEWKFARVG